MKKTNTNYSGSVWRYLGILFFLMVFVLTAQAQTSYTFSGKVTTDTGEPLPGATVQIKGTTFGTVTDVSGEYTFQVNLDAGSYTLEVRSAGLLTEEIALTLGSQTSITKDISMVADVLGLDEILVIGSSVTEERKKIGNAITTIKSEVLVAATPTNITNAIQGKVPGAQITQNSGDPAGGFSIRLRGPSTIAGSSEPLYVVDGVIASNLTTNVTNINVSSGDAAPGQNRMVDFNPNDIENISILNGAAAAAIYGTRASNGVVVITTKKGTLSGDPEFYAKTSINMNRLRKELDLNLGGEQFEGGLGDRLSIIFGRDADGNLTPFQNLLTDKFEVTRFDYQDLIFDTGWGTDNYFSARGGTEELSYFGSIGYTSNEGIIRNTQYNRFTARAKVNHFINDVFSYEVGLAYTNSSSDEKPDGNVFWSPVNPVNITNNIYNPFRGASGELPSVEPTRVNPLSIIEDFDITQDVSRIVPHLRLSIEPLEGLRIDQIAGFDIYNQEGNILIPVYDYEPVNPAYFNDGYTARAEASVFNWNYDVNVFYTRNLSHSITSTTTLGFNYQSSQVELEGNQGRGLDSNGTPSIPLEFFPLDERLDIFGTFLQQSFDIKDKYFLTLAGRIDGATNFDPDERTNFYPKVSASYLISEESFWSKEIVNSARIRASYGEAGNLTAIGPYARFSRYQQADFLGGIALNQESQLGNLGLKPERTREFEIGADLSFLNSKLNVLFTYYRQEIDDLIVNRLVAPSLGGINRNENVGVMENNGIELYLNYSLVNTNKVRWDVNFNYSRNRNEVKETNAGPVSIATVSGAVAQVREGEPLGVFFGTYYLRDINGNIILDDDGLSVAATDPATGDLARKVIGDPNPDFLLAGGTDLRIGGFKFSMLWEAVQGFDVFDADFRTRQGVGIGKIAEREIAGEIPRGSVSAIYPIQEFRVVDGSFVKLREVSIGYTIPEIGRFKNVDFSVQARNLLSIDDFPSYDPETNAGGQSNLLRAVNFGNVPIPQTFIFSVSANF